MSATGLPLKELRLDELQLTVCADVTFRLDGGAMFSIVPRTLWQRLAPPDDANRIPLATNCLVVRGADANGGAAVVLVDTGLGELAADARFRDRFGVTERPWQLLATLRAAGLAPDDVTHVVLTHLHFDHSGGAVISRCGAPQPTFPRARYLVHAGELADARAPDRRSRASYLPATWEPLAAAGVLDAVGSGHEVIPGVRLADAPGHTDHHQVVTVSDGMRTVLYGADLFPTAAHIRPHYVLSFDLDPRRTMATRQRFLDQMAAEDWLLLFEHDPAYTFVTVADDLTVSPLRGEPREG